MLRSYIVTKTLLAIIAVQCLCCLCCLTLYQPPTFHLIYSTLAATKPCSSKRSVPPPIQFRNSLQHKYGQLSSNEGETHPLKVSVVFSLKYVLRGAALVSCWGIRRVIWTAREQIQLKFGIESPCVNRNATREGQYEASLWVPTSPVAMVVKLSRCHLLRAGWPWLANGQSLRLTSLLVSTTKFKQ